jgi:Phage integrase family.
MARTARDLEQHEIDELLSRPLPLAKEGKNKGLPRSATFRVDDRLYVTVSRPLGNDPKRKVGGSWLFRYQHAGRARWMGIGPLHRVTLKQAKRRVAQLNEVLLMEKDPLAIKSESRRRAESLAGHRRTFRQAFNEYVNGGALKAFAKTTQSDWIASVETHALPALGRLAVSQITVDDVARALAPIWYDHARTGRQVRQRIEAVLRWAGVKKYRDLAAPNPANLKDVVSLLPADQAKPVIEKPHDALDWRLMPEFMGRLRAIDDTAARALEMTILTTSRRSEIEDLPWSEVDLDKAVLDIPASRMKGRAGKRRPHMLPLSSRAAEILRNTTKMEGVDFVFPVARDHEALPDVLHALTEKYRGTLNGPHKDPVTGKEKLGPTIHGIARATFRTWCSERGQIGMVKADDAVAETSLHHVKGTKVERVYDRAIYLDERRKLLEEWSAFCGGSFTQPGHL